MTNKPEGCDSGGDCGSSFLTPVNLEFPCTENAGSARGRCKHRSTIY